MRARVMVRKVWARRDLETAGVAKSLLLLGETTLHSHALLRH